MANPERDSAAGCEEQAAQWLWRLDRGLAPEEQDALFEWLTADAANAQALARQRGTWRQLDRLADWRPEHSGRPNPDLLAPPRRRQAWSRWNWAPLAAAAVGAIAAGLWRWNSSDGQPTRAAEHPLAPENRRNLVDGSAVKLNRATELTVLYSESERRVRLERGEGFFLVAKGAVGTAFNVSLGVDAVEVLVAEGTVLVEPPATGEVKPEEMSATQPTALEAKQRVSVPLRAESGPRSVTTLSGQEVKRALAWQHGMMTFDQRSLAAIVAELNLLNEVQLVIRDPAVAAMQFSGTIRSDNVAGLVRLLQSGFKVRSEAVAPNKIVLRSG